MNIKKLVDESVDEISNAITSNLSDSEKLEVRKIVQAMMTKTIKATSNSCTSAVVLCCGPEADLAHKIEHELKISQKVLIANLIGMR